IYIGAVINENGKGHHTILLPEHPDKDMTWPQAMEWAKSIGGDLPSRIEQAMLFDQHQSEFDNKYWYWSNTTHAADADRAWFQHFRHGHQGSDTKGLTLPARAVRRVPIK